MSYIRSGSNPEGLYIVGCTPKSIEIMHSVRPPLSSKWPAGGPSIVVPSRAFHATCRIWADGYEPDKGTSHDGLHVQEIHVFLHNGKPVPANWGAQAAAASSGAAAFLVRLSYGKQFVFMWRVTWMYIVHNATSRPKPRKKTAR